MEADKIVLIPVVDLHDCEVIYDGLGVFWETSYVDTDNRIKFPLAKKKIKNLSYTQHIHSIRKLKRVIICFYIWPRCHSYPEASFLLCFHSVNVSSSGVDFSFLVFFFLTYQ